MLGQPASSQTVCSPSRRTSDFSSVYSGPVRSRVLIHSGLRSIGTWLLRTSRRSSLRPAGSIPGAGDGVGAAVSLMISTVLRDGARPGGEPELLTGAGGGTRRSGPAGPAALGGVGGLRPRAGCVGSGLGLVAGGGGGRVQRRVRRAAGAGARGVVAAGPLWARGRLRGLHAQVGVGRRGVAGRALGAGDGFTGVAG